VWYHYRILIIAYQQKCTREKNAIGDVRGLIENVESINVRAAYNERASSGMCPTPRAQMNVPKKKKTPKIIVDL